MLLPKDTTFKKYILNVKFLDIFENITGIYVRDSVTITGKVSDFN